MKNPDDSGCDSAGKPRAIGGSNAAAQTVTTVTASWFQERSSCITVEDLPAVIAEINGGFVEAVSVNCRVRDI